MLETFQFFSRDLAKGRLRVIGAKICFRVAGLPGGGNQGFGKPFAIFTTHITLYRGWVSNVPTIV